MQAGLTIVSWEPLIGAKRSNNARNPKMWNVLWALCCRIHGLSHKDNPRFFQGLVNVSEMCRVSHCSVQRYFWGIQSQKKGPPISREAAVRFETRTLPTMVARFLHRQEDDRKTAEKCDQQIKDSGMLSGCGECFYTVLTEHAGIVAIDDLGDKGYFSKSGCKTHPAHWVIRSQRSDVTLHLYPGFKCRHLFMHGALRDRCFQVTVVRDTSRPTAAGFQ